MSLKKYMLIDLLILTVIGCIIEAVGVFTVNKMITATMVASAVSLLMMLIATTRWGWKGLFIAPILAAATIISGRFFNSHENFKALYDWKLYIAIVCSLLSFGVNEIWFRYINYKETFKSFKFILILSAIDIVASQLVLSLMYFALAQQFLLLGFLAWNACSFVLLIIGAVVLRKQNVLVNVKENLLEMKNQPDDADFRMNLEENEVQDIEDEEEKKEEKGDFNDGKGY